MMYHYFTSILLSDSHAAAITASDSIPSTAPDCFARGREKQAVRGLQYYSEVVAVLKEEGSTISGRRRMRRGEDPGVRGPIL